MIDKQEFYHGAALIRLLNDPRCKSLTRHQMGYCVNGAVFVLLKYTTKHRSPWRYTFTDEEINQIHESAGRFVETIIVFINAGDGISALSLEELDTVLGPSIGWISMARKFNEQYAVSGSRGSLKHKISLTRWPALVFVK
jgi:hypothetical protein